MFQREGALKAKAVRPEAFKGPFGRARSDWLDDLRVRVGI